MLKNHTTTDCNSSQDVNNNKRKSNIVRLDIKSLKKIFQASKKNTVLPVSKNSDSDAKQLIESQIKKLQKKQLRPLSHDEMKSLVRSRNANNNNQGGREIETNVAVQNLRNKITQSQPTQGTTDYYQQSCQNSFIDQNTNLKLAAQEIMAQNHPSPIFYSSNQRFGVTAYLFPTTQNSVYGISGLSNLSFVQMPRYIINVHLSPLCKTLQRSDLSTINTVQINKQNIKNKTHPQGKVCEECLQIISEVTEFYKAKY